MLQILLICQYFEINLAVLLSQIGQNLADIPVNLNPQIIWLDLRNNPIESVPNNIFENLSVCATLILSDNQIRRIEKNSFQGL